MIYIIFALIATAFVFYVHFADQTLQPTSQKPTDTPENWKKSELQEKIAIIKSSLKDLSYEESIGKIDAENFHFLQNDLLKQWDELNLALQATEQMIEQPQTHPALPNSDNCPQCGALKVAGIQARFCHACGSPL